jgi:hypothetical protein
MANPLETEGSFDPISPKVKLRANQLGVPMDHLDVDNNFEVLRRKLNEVIDEANKNLAEQNVQSDWLDTNVGSDSYILNKPTLSRVATSGNYEDLVNTPDDIIVANSQAVNLAFSAIDQANDRTTAVETSLIELANSAGISLANSVSLSSGLTQSLAELRAVDTQLFETVNTIDAEYKVADTVLSGGIDGLQLQLNSLTESTVSLGNLFDTTVVSLGNITSSLRSDLDATNEYISSALSGHDSRIQSNEESIVSINVSIAGIHTELSSLRAVDVTTQNSITGLGTSINTLSTETDESFNYIEETRSGIEVGEPNTFTLKRLRRDRTIWLRGQIAWIDPLPAIVNDRAYLQIEMPVLTFPSDGALGAVSVHAPGTNSLTLGTEPAESDWYVSSGFCRYMPEGGKHFIYIQMPNLNGKFLWKLEFELCFLLDSSLA